MGLQRRVVIGDRRRGIFHLEIDQAAAVERVAVAGTAPQGLVAIRQRLRQLLDDRSHPTPTVPMIRTGRLEPDRLIVVLEGAVVLALSLIDGAAIVEGMGEVWIELDRLIEVPDGAIVLALSLMGVCLDH
jgi:hypothetical protein